MHRVLQVHRLQGAGQVRPFYCAAQPADHAARAPGLLHRLRHGAAGGAQLGRVFVEQAAGGLGVGQHGGQRLVQFMGHAGGQLAQGIQPRDLA